MNNKKEEKKKIIAEGKVHYWSTMRSAEVWIGDRRDEGNVLHERLASKLYKYRGKNIKLIVEIVKENNAKNKD